MSATSLPAAALSRALSERDDQSDQRAITLLRYDVLFWRDVAQRHIEASVTAELRLLAALRLLRERIDTINEQAKTIERQREQLQDARELWARCAERLMSE